MIHIALFQLFDQLLIPFDYLLFQSNRDIQPKEHIIIL